MEYDISREQIESTYNKIKNHIIKTPVIYATKLSNITDNDVYLKLENLQRAGSFKLRGALSKMMALEPATIKKGVVAASAGNHSQGVSFAANLLNVPATIVMPKTAPISKINATKNYGVEVILHGDFFDDANKKALEIAKAEDKVFVHAFNDLDVIIGQGTIAIEILEELKDVDYILVPIGGGGILSGIASYVKAVNPNCKLIGVQSQNVPSYYEARKTNKSFSVHGKLSIADGIAVKQTGDITFNILNKYVDDVILVSEAEIAETILFLFENCKIVAEGAGAVTTAAMLFNKLNVKNKKIVCVLSGGNIDVTTFLNITNRALINQRRRVILKIDAPLGEGHLTKITNVVDSHGVQIHKISDSQLENSLEINREIIRLVVDINIKAELANIVTDLENLGYTVMEKEFINLITK
ncbi:threonine dehydratase [Spiroplasma sp. NBRC 100390]|uniref:threonine ammonia-lyase n=1 Tax=unclassified Spiroplasma TaxID=2637901 RepID=UPI0008927F58|nr:MULTISPECIES: threonine ammonia-lyase [unclassified Spiroplasma]AOX43799.1 threonine dehydratase [Spiroplasma sp. TU-14]APE13269.1 threonine dehydratase [Spiroplasma sp. NBRC 100390]